ncbi:MAG TPA: hypothetical protein DCR97_06515 [Deltaproteobacteria bacterium]|nr:hypothetical protein [Deltaproteobacteria bacterium]
MSEGYLWANCYGHKYRTATGRTGPQELAEAADGVIACSSPVVEAGLMPYERQVGQTGKTEDACC